MEWEIEDIEPRRVDATTAGRANEERPDGEQRETEFHLREAAKKEVDFNPQEETKKAHLVDTSINSDPEQGILSCSERENLCSIIETDTNKSQLRRFNLRPLIKTEKREPKTFLENIYEILFHNTQPSRKYPTLTLPIKIHNNHNNTVFKECLGTIDTGTNFNFLKHNLINNLNYSKEDTPRIIAANGQPIKILGKAVLPILIGTQNLQTEFLLVQDLSVDLILGNKFLLTYGIEINYKKRNITFHNEGNKESFPMEAEWILGLNPQHILSTIDSELDKLHEVRSDNEFALKGRQHVKIKELDKELHSYDLEVDCNFRNKKKLHAYISTDNNNNKFISVYNPSKISKWVKKNALIGYLKSPGTESKHILTNKPSVKKPLTNKYETGKIIVKDMNGDILDVNPELTIEQHNRVAQILQKYAHMFTNRSEDLKPSLLEPVRVKLRPDAKPVHVQPYRQSLTETRKLDQELDKLVDAGIMQEAEPYNLYASPIFLHHNTDGSARVITDFRELNKQLEKDAFPIPSIESILAFLSGLSYFSKIDFKNSFHQQMVHPEDRKYLTVCTTTRRLMYAALPQGLSISSIAFQRAIVKIISKHLYTRCVCYLDDLQIGGNTFDLQLQNIDVILEELSKFQIKLNTKKSQFLYQSMSVLGHTVTQNGCTPLQSSVEAITQLKLPKNIKSLRSLLGSFNYFRSYLKDFALHALPLTNLIKEYNKTLKFTWNPECTVAVEKLKSMLTSKPILRHFQEDLQTHIYVDASNYALGCALIQVDPITGNEHAVSFLSRKLKDNEINHTVSEKEMTALVYALTKWREFVIGRKVICFTDHKPLEFLQNFKGISSRLTRLSMVIADYDIDVRYRPGTQNGLADFLSRHAHQSDQLESDVLDVCDTLNSLQEIDLSEEQKKDPDLLPIIRDISSPDYKNKNYMKLVDKYMYRDNILYRKILLNQIYKYVIVVPKSLRPTILQEFHDSPIQGGHLNEVKTLSKLRERFYWENMPRDVHLYIRTCDSCQFRKTPPTKTYGLLTHVPIPSQPWQKILLDVIGVISPPSNGYKYILTISDSHSRMAFAYCLKSADAKSITNCLLKLFFVYGVPSVIVSDLGTEFRCNLQTCLTTALGYSHIYASSYSPHVCGQVERFNGVLTNMLSHYCFSKPKNWSFYVDKVVFCYNNTVHHVLKQKPSYLFLGYNVNLPSDTMFALPQCDVTLLERLKVLQEVRDTLPELIKKEHERQAQYYNKNKRPANFVPGDDVLVYYPYTLRTPISKYSQRYRGPFTILHKISDVSFMVEILKNGKLQPESIHVNRLKEYHRREIAVQ